MPKSSWTFSKSIPKLRVQADLLLLVRNGRKRAAGIPGIGALDLIPDVALRTRPSGKTCFC